MAKCWWGKILVNHCYVTNNNPTKILPLNTEYILPVIIISCKHGKLVEIISSWTKQNLAVLPNPKGSLSEKVSSSSIELMKINILEKKTEYHIEIVWSIWSAQKFLIGQGAAKDRVTAMVRYYAKPFPHDSPNSPIFPFCGITVFMIH